MISEEDIKQARAYQLNIFDVAKDKNSIVYLETGTGKTYIAYLMIKKYMTEIWEKEKKIVFVAPTQSLVLQQSEVLRIKIPEIKVDVVMRKYKRKNNKRHYEKKLKKTLESDVLFLTPTTFLNLLNQSLLSLSNVALLIFDECHHAIKHSHYNLIMLIHYFVLKNHFPEKVPRILGLSASLVIQKCTLENFIVYKEQLERNLDSVIVTAKDLLDYRNHVVEPEEIRIPLDGKSDIEDFWSLIIQKGLKDYSQIYKDFKERHKINNNNNDIKFPAVSESHFFEISAELKEAKVLKRIYRKKLNTLSDIYSNIGLYSGGEYAERTYKHYQEVEQHRMVTSYEKSLIQIAIHILRILLEKTNELFKTSKTLKEKVQLGLSCKLSQTLLILMKERLDEKHRGIIFVKERSTAHSLYLYLKTLKLSDDSKFSHISPTYVVGVKRTRSSSERGNKRALFSESLNNFRKGLSGTNLMISTSVLEEGIDVPSLYLVIRYDAPLNLSSYVQSRGRARNQFSKFIVFLQNDEEKKQLDIFSQIVQENYYSSLNTKSNQIEEKREDGKLKETNNLEFFYGDPSNVSLSSVLTNHTALSLLYRYVSSIPRDKFTKYSPQWIFSRESKKERNFVCSLILPIKSGVLEQLTGAPCSSKSKAKKSVAFQACVKLLQIGELNSKTLLPLNNSHPNFLYSQNINEKETNDKLYNKNIKKIGTRNNYSSYTKTMNLSTQFSPLYLYSFHFSHKLQSSIGVLFDIKIPDLTFSLYSEEEGEISINFKLVSRIDKPNQYSSSFTIDLLNKVLSVVPPWMNTRLSNDVLFVPLNAGKNEISDSSPLKTLSNDDIFLPFKENKMKDPSFLAEDSFRILSQTDSLETEKEKKEENEKNKEKKEKKFLSTRNIKKNIYFLAPFSPNHQYTFPPAKRRRITLSSSNDIPEDSNSILQDYEALPIALHKLNHFLTCKSFLDSIQKDLLLNSLPNNSFTSTSLSYSSSTLFDFLIKDRGSVQKRAVMTPWNIYECTTSVTAQDSVNYEKLEILGDSFLKFATSIYLYSQPYMNENKLSSLRSRITSNSNLFLFAAQRDLGSKINGVSFNMLLNWPLPHYSCHPHLESTLLSLESTFKNLGNNPFSLLNSLHQNDIMELNSLLSTESSLNDFTQRLFSRISSLVKEEEKEQKEKEKNDERKQKDKKEFKKETNYRFRLRNNVILSDKVLSDVFEALLGSHLLHFGQEGALMFLSWMGINLSHGSPINECIFSVNSKVSPWTSWPIPSPLQGTIYKEEEKMNFLLQKSKAEELERKIQYSFKDKSLLIEALTHGSYEQNHLTISYERLEFLGDALLEYLLSSYIVSHFPFYEPKDISNCRSVLLNNRNLMSLSLELSLEDHILHSTPLFNTQILELRSFKEHRGLWNISDLNEDSEGVFCLRDVQGPQILSDVFEALVAAIYLDSHYSCSKTWSLFKNTCLNLNEILILKPINPVTEIIQTFGEKAKFVSKVPVKLQNGKYQSEIQLNISGKVSLTVKGFSYTKKRAKEMAAKAALLLLEKEKYSYDIKESSSTLNMTN